MNKITRALAPALLALALFGTTACEDTDVDTNHRKRGPGHSVTVKPKAPAKNRTRTMGEDTPGASCFTTGNRECGDAYHVACAMLNGAPLDACARRIDAECTGLPTGGLMDRCAVLVQRPAYTYPTDADGGQNTDAPGTALARDCRDSYENDGAPLYEELYSCLAHPQH